MAIKERTIEIKDSLIDRTAAAPAVAAFSRLLENRQAQAGLILVGLFIALALLAGWIAPYDPLVQFKEGLDEFGMPRGPNRQFWLGTDSLGRDLLSRIIYGARTSLMISVSATAVAALVGLTIGLLSGYFGGWVDSLFMRLTDIFLSFPVLLLAMALVAIFRPSIWTVIFVLGFVFWTYVARLVRGQALTVMKRDYITAAYSLGLGHWRIITRHLLPNVISSVIIWTALSMATTILVQAALGYLGIGVRPPTPDWGEMISNGQEYFRYAPGLTIFPGLAIALTVLGFNLLGDALRDVLDPNRDA